MKAVPTFNSCLPSEIGKCSLLIGERILLLKLIDSESFIDIIPPPEETYAQLRKQRLEARGWSLSPDSNTVPIDLSENSLCERKDYRSFRLL